MLATKEILLVVAIVACLGSPCLSAPSNNGQNSNQNNHNSGRNNRSGQNNGYENRVIDIGRGPDGRLQIRVRLTEAGFRQSGQSSGSGANERPLIQGNRDYVENDRDYQNLLDLLRREAEEEEERKNNLKNFVPDNVSPEQIERLFAAAATEPSFALDSAESTDGSDGDDSQPDCPICLESMADREKSMPQCKHKFHTKCLGKWMSQAGDGQGKCPVCRSPVIKTLKIRRKSAANAKAE